MITEHDRKRTTRGLRLILFDRTCTNRVGFGLTRAWQSGSHLYAWLGRSDGAHGAESFADALGWLGRYRADRAIDELQFWGHGKWGRLFLRNDVLDRSALVSGHAHHRALASLRERLSPGALVWFRSCETFGAVPGQDFAKAWTTFFGRAAAGHTFVIGYWQSGLHRLEPGMSPRWRAEEGLLHGTITRPERAAFSGPTRPNTISCLTGRVPAGW